jgi:acetoin utilization protein AcuB
MSKTIPHVQKYMSTCPVSIGSEQTLATAQKVMRDHQIRHLPVLDGGNLVGVLSERDIQRVETFRDVDPLTSKVADAMSLEPFVVDPAAALDAVAAEMAEKRLGAAVVMQNHKVVGVFTTVDGMRALSELLQSRLA